MNRKILVTGANSMVGSRFVELSSNKFDLLIPNESELDITDKDLVKKFIGNNNVDAIVNFAAYTNVNEAEKQLGDKNGICWKVNVEGVRNLVDSIEKSGIHFVQISTDMVFSGSESDPGPYSEDKNPETDLSKLTWYGYTKAEADIYVMNRLRNKATIIRIIYPVRANFENKSDYLRKPLELYDEGKLYPLITDQQISISFIDEIAEVLAKVLEKNIIGVCHVSTTDTTSPFQIVSYLLHKVRHVQPDKLNKTTLVKLLLATGQPKYRYPKFGGLAVEQTQEKLGMQFRNWQEVVDELISQGLGD